MAFERPITVKEAISNIRAKRYALPAIQRELVWDTRQIQRLFDSLMRGYPIGAFLFWAIEPANTERYKFYDFILHYHQRKSPHCPPLEPIPNIPLKGVLDGQQRLTALNIGLRGSYTRKLPRLWRNNPNAFPRRHLYLDLLNDAAENEDGIIYDFRLLTDEQVQQSREGRYWYRVGNILNIENPLYDFIDFIQDAGLQDQPDAQKRLSRLYQVIHSDPVISYYEEQDQELAKVLDIFIRTNSGGSPLSHSDLLLSIATATWKTIDAREAIYDAVDELNEIGSGFSFDKDFVLKAGLMLADITDVGFKVTNFNNDNMNRLEKSWDKVFEAISVTVKLISDFGFSSRNLPATNSLLPIAYYLRLKGFSYEFVSSVKYESDREQIKEWLMRALIKRGVWGSGVDNLLRRLRDTVREYGHEHFPAGQLARTMAGLGKELTFTEDELLDIVDTSYSEGRSFAVLSMLYPFVNVSDHVFHIDHITPRKECSPAKLKASKIDDATQALIKDRINRLGNLQLLNGNVNASKGTMMPARWLDQAFDSEKSQSEYIRNHDLDGAPYDLHEFNRFYESRRQSMLVRLRKILGVRKLSETN